MLPLLLCSGLAFAQEAPELNSQLLRPSIDGQTTLWADDATFFPELRPSARLLLSYANNPLVFETSDGEVTEVVSDLTQADLLLGVGRGRVHLGLGIPVVLNSEGTEVTGSGFGDLTAALRVGLLDPTADAVGLALQGRLLLATSSMGAGLASAGTGYELGAVVDYRMDRTTLLANLGTRGQPEAILDNVVLDDQLYARLGITQALDEAATYGVGAEAGAHANYSASFSNTAAVPVELLGTGWIRFGDFVLRGGAGGGLTRGIGAPAYRMLLGIGYEPALDGDRDRDGIKDSVDRCPDQAEDVDGYKDTDGCPDAATPVSIRFVDEDGNPVSGVRLAVDQGEGFKELDVNKTHAIHPGTHGLQATVDDFVPLTTTLEVPEASSHEVTKVLVRPTGTIEVRVVGADGRLVDARWSLDGGDRGRTGATSPRVKVPPGEHTVRVSANGYRPAEVSLVLKAGTSEVVEIVLVPSRVVVTTERIELREVVNFDLNKATIQSSSFALLDEVAQVMRENPQIKMLRIEGHTDERGSDSHNQKLSDARATSVRQYLESKGVAAERLRSIGFGETRPLVAESNEAAWEKNRRVEMWIEERTD